MTCARCRLPYALLLSTLLLLGLLVLSSPVHRVASYTPVLGHQTSYDYGFINTQLNQSADDVFGWTELALPESNYTLVWHQYVNLSISVTAVATSEAHYRFNVTIHCNHVTISNSSPWQTEVTLNGSVTAPAPTGVTNGVYIYPIHTGLPGFFLDETTLASISTGTDVLVGGSRWDTITNTEYALAGSNESCYQLENVSTTLNSRLETQYIIDQDVGIYFSANETTIHTFGTLQQTITYYFRVLATTILLFRPPDLTLVYLLFIVITVVILVLVIFVARFIRRRQQRSAPPPEPRTA